MIKKENGKYIVWNEDKTKRLAECDTKDEAVKRLRQIEYFKKKEAEKK